MLSPHFPGHSSRFGELTAGYRTVRVLLCCCAPQAVAEHLLLDALYHAASVKVPVICWELVQSVQCPLQHLKGSSRSHGVLITVRVLPVVAVSR